MIEFIIIAIATVVLLLFVVKKIEASRVGPKKIQPADIVKQCEKIYFNFILSVYHSKSDKLKEICSSGLIKHMKHISQIVIPISVVFKKIDVASDRITIEFWCNTVKGLIKDICVFNTKDRIKLIKFNDVGGQ